MKLQRPKLQDDAVLKRLRKICLSLPETSEKLAWGHPNFRAGKKMFVAYERFRERPSIAFHVSSSDVLPYAGKVEFFATPYGRGQWRSIWSDGRIDWRIVSELARRAYESVALQRMRKALDARVT